MTRQRKSKTRTRLGALKGFNGDTGLDSFAPYELSQTVAVLTQAVESNERQIHEVAQTNSQNIKDLSVLIEKQGSQTSSRLEALAENFQASQKPNYMLWLAALAVFFTLVSAGWKITDLQTQVTMAPISAKVEVNEKDAAAVHKDISEVRSSISSLDAQQKVVGMQLREVETQFRASDRARNVQFAEQQRMNNIMTQLSQGKGGKDSPVAYPSGPFYFPEISQDGGTQQQ